MNIRKLDKLQTFIPKMRHVKQIHFIGIGGVGMSGIAEILVKEGYHISGSELSPNTSTQKLINLGARIYLSHRRKNIGNASVVVVSSAITLDNPEILAAKQACIPIIQRGEMLAELMRFRYGIAVAGTHGKTTTTAMLTSIYLQEDLDPTFINGGLIKAVDAYAHLGLGRNFITEADESDASFLYLHPMMAIITNIEADHMETYQGDFENLKKAFIKFLHNLPFYGRAVMCIDNQAIRDLLPYINRKIITYGFSDDADLRIIDYSQNGTYSDFIIIRSNKTKLKVKLNAPGHHNALNSAAAIAIATEEKINDNNILQAMLEFKGTSRRFDNLGNYNLYNINKKIGEVMLIDDYGHHPTEVDATINAVRAAWPHKRLIMVFQPHRYTRTRDFYFDFANVLSRVDVLLMLDVYPAGEALIAGCDSDSLCQTIHGYGKVNPILISNVNILLRILTNILKNKDLILTQGAGTVGDIARKIADKWSHV